MSYANDTYLKALSASRGDIDRNVANTLAEISRQRDMAVGQAQQIPGAVGNATTESSRIAKAGLGQADQSLAALGLGRIGAPVTAQAGKEVGVRMKDIQGSYGRASGLLQQGFDEQKTQRQGSANRIGQQLLTENNLKAQEYIAGRASEDRDRAFQTDMMNRSAAQQDNALSQQAAMQEAAIAAQTAQAQQQRDWQARQNLVGMIHQATLANPLLTTPSVIEDMYEMGQAPPGMSLSDFANWLGMPIQGPTQDRPGPNGAF